jgi:hypothetical protein
VPNRIDGGLYVGGGFACDTFAAPTGSITDNAILANAKVAASKLRHRYQPVYAQSNTAATAETRALYCVLGATGTVTHFRAGVIGVFTGNAVATVDLRKNGASILSAVVTLDNANVARVAEAGTVTGGSVVAGDLLEIVTTVNAGTGALGTGLFAIATIEEDYA